jgi:hypothetical protein
MTKKPRTFSPQEKAQVALYNGLIKLDTKFTKRRGESMMET